MSSPIKLEIIRPGKEPELYPIEQGNYTIGADDDCHIRLHHPEVDSRHAILSIRPDGQWIEDLYSTNGTLIDGQKSKGRSKLSSGQQFNIGPFSLIVHNGPPAETKAPEPVQPAQKAPSSPVVAEKKAEAPMARPKPVAPPAPSQASIELKRSIKKQIHKELIERLDIKRLSASRIQRDELSQKAKSTIEKIVSDVRHKLPPEISPESIIKEVYDEALRLGPLEDLLADDSVTEIMVNGPHQVYAEKNGKLVLTDMTFMDESSVLAIIERIVSPIGRRIDESQPYVDARLPDGSRVNAIIHPLSLVGPCLTIRKFSRDPFTVQDLINFGTITQGAADFLSVCVKLRKNIIVAGGTGSGKTTFLNVLSSYLPDTDRILTIEDAAELRLTQRHVVRLEARPPNIEGRGAIAIRDLVRNALRMRPDRIVVGECRGGEALDMLQAMNTGHDGSLTTVHANSPRDVISRLETMVLMSGMELPVRAIREQVASAVDMIVHESRMSDGSRKITKITEVMGLEGDQIVMQDIFEYKQTGVDEEGRVQGYFRATGSVPTFLEDITARGLNIDRSIFDPRNYQQPS
jgi:pilus assembly protein CpaF